MVSEQDQENWTDGIILIYDGLVQVIILALKDNLEQGVKFQH